MSPPPPPSSSDLVVSNGVAQQPSMVSGILYKWVNCGKGWRPRWFVLQDGVLSYYKIHRPDRIIVTRETKKGCRVIDSRLSRNRHHVNPHHLQRKPLGELHLKVSSISESSSDDRRFSIFTGTKRLHLKANTSQDQREWMEALKAVKQMFPRMPNSELMNPSSSVTVSTQRLRARLLEEGVNETVIQDVEKIMRIEFSAMQDQLMIIQKKVRLLSDTLHRL